MIKALFSELKITPIYNVSYSPDFNPIETVFASVKRIFKRERLHALTNGHDFDLNMGIRRAFSCVTKELV